MTFPLWILWISVLCLKILLGISLPISSDEAYYWVWSHDLQLSYYDHPGMVAWWAALGHSFENFHSAFRIPAIVLGHFIPLIWIQLLRPLLPERDLLFFMALYFLMPLLGPGSLILTPDLPLMLFWSLGLWALVRALNAPTFWRFFLVGATFGLGFCSKYHAVLLIPLGLVMAMIQLKFSRRLWIAFFATFFGFVIFSSPVFYWNWQNDWVSFRFQLNHGLGESHYRWNWTAEYILGQIALLFPVVAYFGFRSIQRFKELPLWLTFSAIFPLGFFFLTSFKGDVEANWPIVAYPSMLALAVYWIGKNRSHRLWLKATATIWLVVFSAVVAEVHFGVFPKTWPIPKLKELNQFRDLAQTASSEMTPLYARSYQMAAKMSFEMKRPVLKMKGFGRIDYYDLKGLATPSDSPYFVAVKANEDLPRIFRESGHRIVHRFPTVNSVETHSRTSSNGESIFEIVKVEIDRKKAL